MRSSEQLKTGLKRQIDERQRDGERDRQADTSFLFASGCTTYLPATIQSSRFEGPSDRLQGHHQNSLE